MAWNDFSSYLNLTTTSKKTGNKIILELTKNQVNLRTIFSDGGTTNVMDAGYFMNYYMYNYRYLLKKNGTIIDTLVFTAEQPYAPGIFEYSTTFYVNDTITLTLQIERKSINTDGFVSVLNTPYIGIVNSAVLSAFDVYSYTDTKSENLLMPRYSFISSGNWNRYNFDPGLGDYKSLSKYDLINFDYVFEIHFKNTLRNILFEPAMGVLSEGHEIGDGILSQHYGGSEELGSLFNTSNLQVQIKIYEIPKISASVKINGAHKQIDALFAKINGTYKKATSIYTKINGVWRK